MLEVFEKLDTQRFRLNQHHYAIHHEPITNIIYTAAKGFWSLDHANSYIKALGDEIAKTRARHDLVNVLVDRRETPVLSAEVATLLQKANQDFYTPNDRLAVVVDSSLLKLQLRRLFAHEGSKAFLSVDAAVTWLRAR